MDKLTRHQQRICQLVAEGFSNKEIASILTVSVQTVKNHLYIIFDAIGVHNRTLLALEWIKYQEKEDNNSQNKIET